MKPSNVTEVGAFDLPRCEHASSLRLIQPVSERISRFPSTRYYGSKRKLLGWMYGHLGPLRFDSALDAFGGTGSVSLLFQAMNKRVTYHDGFRFNEDVARTVLAAKPPLTRYEIEELLAAVEPRSGVITQHFMDIFFKEEENSWLDGFISILDEKCGTPETRSLLRFLIYQACLKKRPFNLFHRANLRLRTKEGVKRTFGNAVTWERSFSHHALQAYVVCLGKAGPILKRALRGVRVGEGHGTSAVYAGADHREAA